MHFVRRAGRQCRDRRPGRRGARHHIGEIELALGVAALQVAQPVAQASGGCRHQAGVGLAHQTLRRRRVQLLDDAGHGAVGAPLDAPISGGIVEFDGQNGERAGGGGGAQRLEAVHRDQRHIAVQHQDRVIVGYHGHGLHDGMAGAALLGLQHPLHVFMREGALHLGAAMPIHHADLHGPKLPGHAYHMLQQRLAGERLQDLGQVRVHALALSRGEYDDG